MTDALAANLNLPNLGVLPLLNSAAGLASSPMSTTEENRRKGEAFVVWQAALIS